MGQECTYFSRFQRVRKKNLIKNQRIRIMMLVFQNLYFIYANEIQMGVCAIKVVWGQKLEPLRWA